MLIKSQMSPKNYWWEQPALKIKPKLIFPPNDSPWLVAQTLTISYNHWNLIHPFLTPPGRTGLRFLWASQNISRALSLLFQQVLSVMYDDIWLLIVTAFYPFYEKKLWGDFMSSVVFLPSNSITFLCFWSHWFGCSRCPQSSFPPATRVQGILSFLSLFVPYTVDVTGSFFSASHCCSFVDIGLFPPSSRHVQLESLPFLFFSPFKMIHGDIMLFFFLSNFQNPWNCRSVWRFLKRFSWQLAVPWSLCYQWL